MIEKELRLKVAEAVQDDVNKGIVRVDTAFMHQIGVRPGDIIEIEGGRKTVAIADRAYPGDIGLNLIRMDGIIRRNAKTSIGDLVKIQKADVKEAKKVVIAPARKGIIIRASADLFKQGLLGRVLAKGDIVALGGGTRRRTTMAHSPFEDIFRMLDEDVYGFGFGDIKFLVVDTAPKQAIIVSDQTEVVFNPEAVEVSEEATLEVTYEDIGGLSEEIKKVREMVELPLKHPEIFERLGIEAPKGVLLHGPPGTGKTLLAKAVANETNAHFILINGPEIMCVDGETKIFTNPKGHIKAKDIYKNAKGKKCQTGVIETIELKKPINTFSFSKDKVIKSKITHVTKLKANAYSVSFSNGNRMNCSKNQPFLVYKNGTLEWRRLEELNKGALVARLNKINLPQKSQKIKLDGFEEKDSKLAPAGRNLSRSNWISVPKTTSTELMELIGLIMAEGYVHEDGITFANNDEKIRNRYKGLLKNLFAISKTTEYSDGRVVAYSKVLSRLMALFGMLPGKKKPVIPPFFYKLPKEEVAAFVQGYFDGDGCVALTNEYPSPKLFSSSQEFLQELQTLMMLKLEIPTKINEHKTPKNMMYKLDVRGNEGRHCFSHWIRPISEEKRRRLSKLQKCGKDWARLPRPEILINAIRKNLPYASFRHIDSYIYNNKVPITKHALNKLYETAKKEGIATPLVEKENELLSRQDIAWEEIDDISNAGEQELFDFSVVNDSFVAASGLLLHNSKFYGQSEQNLRKKFEEAEKNSPSIIFIDEIDAIASKREEVHGEVERRVVAQLLALMDGLKSRGKVIVIAASNVPNLLDPALRRPGRFDREIEIGVPSKEGRLDILKIHTRNMPLKSVNLKDIAAITHGFVGADLAALCKESAMIVLRRVLPELMLQKDEPIPKELLEKLMITKKDLKEALKVVRPSAMREVLVEVPTVKWSDIGGLDDVKQELIEAVEWPIKHADAFKRLGVTAPKGILLYGAPGTGKTMLAKAVATESEANFIQVKGPELLSKWVGESEKAVREIFKKARQTSPTVVFFDEIDSLAPRRGMSSESHVTERVVNQLLTEIDGLEDLYDVVVIAATNRPDMVDPAILRPGRFDRLIITPVPEEKARLEILKVHTKSMPLKDVDLDVISAKTEGYVGADIEAVCREAAILALRKDINAKVVTEKHFEEALKKVRASVTKEIEEAYEGMKEQFKAVRAKQLKEEKPSYMG